MACHAPVCALCCRLCVLCKTRMLYSLLEALLPHSVPGTKFNNNASS
jgi:hypothetical protein